MLKMIKYNLKKRSLLIIITCVVVLAIAFALFLNDDFLRTYYIYSEIIKYSYDVIGPSESPMTFIAIIACILCTIIPIIEFSFKMSKISIDQMYSLPIKREKLYIAKFISGFIEVLIPVCAATIFCVIKVLLTDHMYEMIYFLPYFGCLVFFMFILYSTVTFFYTRGNTIIDGIINVVFIIFALEFVLDTADSILWGPITKYYDAGTAYIYSPIGNITYIFDNMLSAEAVREIYDTYGTPGSYSIRTTLYIGELVPTIMLSIIGIGSAILFVVLNKKDKAEDSMQISNSWFSYKVFIPIYFSCISLLFMDGGELISFVFIFVGTYITYVIYRRSLKINKKDLLVIAICFISMILLYVLLDNIKPSPMNYY